MEIYVENVKNNSSDCAENPIYLTAQENDVLHKLNFLSMSVEETTSSETELKILATEIQETHAMFDAVQEKLLSWRSKIVTRLRSIEDSVAQRLEDASRAQQLKKKYSSVTIEQSTMTDANQAWLLEAHKRVSEFKRARSELRSRQSSASEGVSFRVVGDVAVGIQELLFETDRHVRKVMKRCWLDLEKSNEAEQDVCLPIGLISKLESTPYHVTCCTNSSGFFSDASCRIIRAIDAEGLEDASCLPMPLIYVAFGRKQVEHLLVTTIVNDKQESISSRFRCHCEGINWSNWILGIHCDSVRQLLFIAQGSAVTVTDLRGHLERLIDRRSLNLDASSSSLLVSDMACDSNRTLLLDKVNREILIIDQGTYGLERVINLKNFNVGGLDGLALCGSKLILLDLENDRLHRLCTISQELIATYPADGQSELHHPWRVAVDPVSGVVFVSERNANQVLALSVGDFSAIRRLDGSCKTSSDKSSAADYKTDTICSSTSKASSSRSVGARTFKHPTGLTLLRCEQVNALIVCDWGRKRLCVYRLLN